MTGRQAGRQRKTRRNPFTAELPCHSGPHSQLSWGGVWGEFWRWFSLSENPFRFNYFNFMISINIFFLPNVDVSGLVNRVVAHLSALYPFDWISAICSWQLLATDRSIRRGPYNFVKSLFAQIRCCGRDVRLLVLIPVVVWQPAVLKQPSIHPTTAPHPPLTPGEHCCSRSSAALLLCIPTYDSKSYRWFPFVIHYIIRLSVVATGFRHESTRIVFWVFVQGSSLKQNFDQKFISISAKR